MGSEIGIGAGSSAAMNAARAAGREVGKQIAQLDLLGKTPDDILKGATAQPAAWGSPRAEYTFSDGRTATLNKNGARPMSLELRHGDGRIDTVNFDHLGKGKSQATQVVKPNGEVTQTFRQRVNEGQ